MDEFPELLSRDFGIRPQGKASPMATARGSGKSSSGSVPLPSFTTSASGGAKSNRESPLSDEPADKGIAGFGGSSSGDYGGGLGDLDRFLGGGSSWKSKSVHNSSSFDYDSMFDNFKDPVPPKAKPASGPVFDTPIYDEDDMFDGVPGLKTSSAGKFDDVFASLSSSSNRHIRTRDDDLLGDLGGKGNISNTSGRKQSGDAEQTVPGFDDLIPGFGGGGSPQKREYSGTNRQRSSSQPNKSTTSVSTDPFADLESTSVSSYPSAGSFVDPLASIGVSSGSTKLNASNGLFDDVNSFKGLNNSTPFFPSDEDIAKTSDQIKQTHPTAAKEFTEKAPANISADARPTKVAGETHREPEQSNLGIPNTKSDFDQFEINNEHPQEDEDVWLTVSEIPLFTQPTSAPPPSRPPPFSRRKSTFAHANRSESANVDAKSMANDSVPLSNHKQNCTFSESFTDSSKSFGFSSVDELEDFAMGKPQMCAEEQPGVISSEEDNETSSAAATSAAAMKDAMDKAEAKIKQARELRERERESRTTQNREFAHQVKKEKTASDFHNLETQENLENFDVEKERKEREEKEKERRRLEREREKAFVEKTVKEARQRAAVEARERAAAGAKQKAERAAVEKANAEARERAARAAVNRATAEARERVAAEARDRAAAEARERAGAEARERTAREAREREAREREIREREAREKVAAMTRESQRAAVQRAAADARQRAERAAVEKANREARERAAAAAASAREKQSKNENDLDSVFGMGSRATSEPKHRPATPDFSFDGQIPSKGGSTGARNVSSASSSSGMRKTSSANFLDDLTSVFGAPSSSGEFQEIDGESEERRRARLERHQRTLERAAKALAEKNQRDMQAQREQAEKDRIAERMEVEIKRWAAGKEGNLRALLSTLQYVLWPECGWQAVSLTDLITAASVKKVYRKATLHLHPDKVQQKGANLEQKIIAEKVFDLLKEAWNKFNSEELF